MYDVAVVGSGYGGSVIAARLAPHARVVVIERGRAWQPHEFPRTVLGLARAYRSARNPGGLWEMRLGEGTGNALASAFGGSSAVNYGICAQPELASLASWPFDARVLEPYFDRARQVLRPAPNPIAHTLGDQQFLDRVEPGLRRDIENTIDWSRCDQCGRCVPGCRRGAKRSLDRSYLALAAGAGAEIEVETEARLLEPIEGGWGLWLGSTRTGRTTGYLHARQVVIAAGTLGTHDLLHRSRARLPLGTHFGRHLSMNGDGLAFLYDTRHQLSSHHGAPISTSARIPFAAPDGSTRTLTVMSGRVPMAAMRFAGAALAVAAGMVDDPSVPRDDSGSEHLGHLARRARDLLGVGARGAVARSFMFKLDGQDEGRGAVRFTPAGAVIDWKDYADDPIMLFAERRLRAWAAVAGGTVIPNIARLPGMRSFSVHPLGGCRIGATIEDGVVDQLGRVFDPRGDVYPGLRIADGSILPGSPGVPPSFTIAALAERIAESMIPAARLTA